MFENHEIEHEDLPKVDTVSWQGMDSEFKRRLLTEAALALLFVTIGIGGLQTIFSIAFDGRDIGIGLVWLWLLIPLLAIPLLSWPLISVPRIGYAVRDKDIIYKSGVFWQTVTAIPFN